jgi:uncharacterized pyridoxamine 5'-phosphate oxidase family protein
MYKEQIGGLFMERIIEFLNKNKIGQFTTIKNGNIVMRLFNMIFYKLGKFYFGTGNNKDVYRQLNEDPTASFAVVGENMQWLRLSGKIKFVDDCKLKESMFEEVPALSSVYGSAESEIFKAFYFYEGSISLHNGIGDVIEESIF